MEILPSIETLNYHIYLMNFLVLSLIGSYQSMKHVFFKIRFLSIGICIFPHFFCNSFLISGEILLKKKITNRYSNNARTQKWFFCFLEYLNYNHLIFKVKSKQWWVTSVEIRVKTSENSLISKSTEITGKTSFFRTLETNWRLAAILGAFIHREWLTLRCTLWHFTLVLFLFHATPKFCHWPWRLGWQSVQGTNGGPSNSHSQRTVVTWPGRPSSQSCFYLTWLRTRVQPLPGDVCWKQTGETVEHRGCLRQWITEQTTG